MSVRWERHGDLVARPYGANGSILAQVDSVGTESVIVKFKARGATVTLNHAIAEAHALAVHVHECVGDFGLRGVRFQASAAVDDEPGIGGPRVRLGGSDARVVVASFFGADAVAADFAPREN